MTPVESSTAAWNRISVMSWRISALLMRGPGASHAERSATATAVERLKVER